ncbi:MAG: D-alanyl-D-alanine carboxypeptidase family protein, partial [Gemmobacter sp.]
MLSRNSRNQAAARALRASSDAFGALFREQGGYEFMTGKLEKMFGVPRAEDPVMSAAAPVVSAMAAVEAARLERDPEIRLQRMSAAMAALVEQVRIAVEFDGKRTQAEENLLATLQEQNLALAEQAALRDGSAKAAAIARQIGEIVQDYERQAELTRVIALHGEQSAEAEAVRARHLREGLEEQLRQMGADTASAEAARTRAALEARIAAEAEARSIARRKAEGEIAADLGRQQALSQAILQFGESSAEVEALRAMHARDVFRARLAEQGILGPLADSYVRLMEAEQDRQRAIRAMNDGRTADGMLATLREERAINQAILSHGEGSLRVRELQIAAERRLYEESLATLQVTEARKKELMAEWELTHGLKSADPFGRIAANRDALRSHHERMDRLQLELRLVGQTNAMREKTLAMHEAELEARKVGGDVAEWRARAGAMADLTREVQRQTEAWDRARQAAEGMIDGPIDALLKGDLKGAVESFGQELLGLWADLALKNPLKNRLLGTNYATMDDIGGLSGFFGRLFGGQPVLPTAEAQARAVTTAAMTVTTPMVTISTSGLSGLPLAAGLMPAANLPVPPAMGPVAGPSMAAASLHRVAIGGALRPDALTGLHSGFASQLAAMVAEAERALGPGVVKITSAFRSVERQAELFEQAVRKYGSEAEARKWAAPPGKSNHNAGLAADLEFATPAARAWVHGNAARFGLGFPMSWEPWHIEPANARAMRQAGTLPVAQLERLATTAEMATGQLGSFGARAETTGHGLASLGGTFAQALQMFGASRGPGGMIAATLLG